MSAARLSRRGLLAGLGGLIAAAPLAKALAAPIAASGPVPVAAPVVETAAAADLIQPYWTVQASGLALPSSIEAWHRWFEDQAPKRLRIQTGTIAGLPQWIEAQFQVHELSLSRARGGSPDLGVRLFAEEMRFGFDGDGFGEADPLSVVGWQKIVASRHCMGPYLPTEYWWQA